MPRMVRKQIYIKPEQDAMLKQRAKQLGITESELIRRGITQVTHPSEPRKLDHHAWEEELAFIRERAQATEAHDPPVERTWTREELYDERLDRWLPR